MNWKLCYANWALSLIFCEMWYDVIWAANGVGKCVYYTLWMYAMEMQLKIKQYILWSVNMSIDTI